MIFITLVRLITSTLTNLKRLSKKLLVKDTTPKAQTFVTLPNHKPGIITVNKDDEIYGCVME